MTSSRLSRFGDVLQIVVCLIVLAIALSTYVNRTAGSSAVGSRAALESGIPMDQLPGVSFAARPLTLILFERSDCTFCTQSMPFYRELSTFIDKARVQFVVASWEERGTTERYLSEHNVAADHIVQLDSEFRHSIRGTPTLVLVDNMGTVRDSWVGLLD